MNYFKLWFDVPVEFEGHCYIEIDKAECWLIKGRTRHREDGPAIIVNLNNDVVEKHWYVDDNRHRLDGPAIQGAGRVYYFIDDKIIHKKDYWKHPMVIKTLLKKIIEL